MSAAASPANARAWAFALGGAGFFLSFFHRVAMGALAPELTETFAISATALGALAGTYFYIYTLMQVPTGIINDTVGPRLALAAGGYVAAAGSVVFGLAETFTMAAVGRTLAGLGVSVAFVSMLKLNANWFAERRFATALGAANVIGMAGALAATAPLAWLITQVSWRAVFVGVGVASFIVATLTLWRVHDAPVERPAERHGDWRAGLRLVMANRATWAGFFVNFGFSGTYMTFMGLWLVPLLINVHGLSPVAASQHAALVLITFACSAPAVGWLSDRIGVRRPLVAGFGVAYALAWVGWFALPPGVPVATYAMCVATGIVAPAFILSWANAKEVNPRPLAGIATSVVNLGGFLSAGILQPLVGWLVDRGAAQGDLVAGYRWGLAALGAFALIGVAGAFALTETRCRNIWQDRNTAREAEPAADKGKGR